MKNPIRFCLSLFLTLSLLLMSFGTLAAAPDNAATRKIVVFQERVAPAAQDALLSKAGAATIKSLPLVNAAVVMATPAAERALARFGEVLYIEDDVVATILGKPDKPGKPGGKKPPPQPDQTTPWGVNRIDAEFAWDTSTGSGVKVAVVDTGIDLSHPDLNVAPENFNAINSRKSANDDNGHGTHVAGTIAALNDDYGVVGVAPGASLYAVKVLDRSGSGWVSDIIEGIEWCITHDIQVINMSLGASQGTTAFESAIDAAYTAGIIIVAAAGNDYGGPVNYPAAYDHVIAVSAVNADDTIATFSNIGTQVELAAPGVGIFSTYKGGTYATMSGTSMAAPHVTGVVALVLEDKGSSEVLGILQNSADDLGSSGWDNKFGFGLVDAGEAVTGTLDYGDDLPPSP